MGFLKFVDDYMFNGIGRQRKRVIKLIRQIKLGEHFTTVHNLLRDFDIYMNSQNDLTVKLLYGNCLFYKIRVDWVGYQSYNQSVEYVSFHFDEKYYLHAIFYHKHNQDAKNPQHIPCCILNRDLDKIIVDVSGDDFRINYDKLKSNHYLNMVFYDTIKNVID